MLRWLIGRPDDDEVRLPVLRKNHESNVPGLYIVGDLAGAPTIKVAANQGHEVMRHIAGLPDGRAERARDVRDVIIVGGGSSGIAAALEAKDCGLSFLVIEGSTLASTIREFPRAKEIYAEPAAVENRTRMWVEDSLKEELLERWDAMLAEEHLDVRERETVTDIRRVAGAFEVVTDKSTHRGRRVVLAIGKRGNPRRLGVPGEDRPKVFGKLYDPEEHRGENVLVVGGGDSAVEAALALSEVATTTLSYRRERFFRLQTRNREKIERARDDGRVEVLFSSEVKEIRETEVVLTVEGRERTLPNNCTLVSVGADLPTAFFRRIGIKMEKQWTPWRIAAAAAVLLAFWCAYAAKHYEDEGTLFPLNLLELTWNSFQLGRFHWWEWYTFLYSAAVLVFGVKAFRKYRYSRLQRWKYASVIFFQCFMLCIFPIFIVPKFAPDWYANANYAFHLVLAWPLQIGAIPKPFAAGDWGPFVYALVLTFVVLPVFTYFVGKRYCSWICGCGALAETLGDEVRHLAPRGPRSIRWERINLVVLGLAAVLTFATMFFTSWDLASRGMHLYGIWIDTMFAGAIGVAFYWFMGNRIWCRYGCPLRIYMNLTGAIASRFKIVPARDKCIACGQCSRQCQMGIPVMDFAKKGEAVTLANSACVGCGICVDVCPVDVLHYSEEMARAAEPKKTGAKA